MDQVWAARREAGQGRFYRFLQVGGDAEDQALHSRPGQAGGQIMKQGPVGDGQQELGTGGNGEGVEGRQPAAQNDRGFDLFHNL